MPASNENSSVRQAKRLLFTTFNCAKAQLIPLQEISQTQDEAMIMALTGLAGGMLNNGSTCGVVFGGAISTALIRDKELGGQWTEAEQIRLLAEIGEHVRWFETRFQTSLCRERPEVGYERITLLGLLNPKKVRGCVARTAASMERLSARHATPPSPPAEPTEAKLPAPALHCATHILRTLREETGIGNRKLERVAVALDGGIGLTGGGCGALAGALMTLGLAFALDPAETDPKELRNVYRSMDSQFFRMAKELMRAFLKAFGALECRRLSGTRFSNYADFTHHRQSGACAPVHDFILAQTRQIIQRQPDET